MSYELERNRILTEEEINKLLFIVNSDLQDFEKAKQLRTICKGTTLLMNTLCPRLLGVKYSQNQKNNV